MPASLPAPLAEAHVANATGVLVRAFAADPGLLGGPFRGARCSLG